MLELFHKCHLMGMDILKGKRIRGTLFCIKADRDPLDCPNVIYRTFLFKIGQSDMAVFLVDPDGGDWRRDFLDQRQPFFPVLLICPVDQVLQDRTSQASGIPCRHIVSSLPAVPCSAFPSTLSFRCVRMRANFFGSGA